MTKKQTAIRWTIARAASEFHVDPKTLSKKLRKSQTAGEDGAWSTRQIAAAIFGDIERERLRNLTVDTEAKMLSKESAALDLAHKRNELVTAESAFLDYSCVLHQAKREIELLPAAVAHLVANKDAIEVQRILDDEVHAALTRIATGETEQSKPAA